MDLKDKVVVITGGADGIGLDIAYKFTQSGAKTTIILDMNSEKGKKAAQNINFQDTGNAVFIQCDVTKDLEEMFNKIATEYGEIDVLVNCAIKADEPKHMIEVGLTAPIEWSLKFYKHMRLDKAGNKGTIINISSIFGYRVYPIFPTYHAIKFGLTSFSRSLGHEDNFKKSKVRIITICPGFTKTKSIVIPEDEIDEQIQEVITSHEIQDVGVVGDAVVDLYKNAASGTVWLVEGGRPAQEVVFPY